MNTYYLNDIPLSRFGFVPGHAAGSNIALSGAWDMPARSGDSCRQWAGEDGVEPYVEYLSDMTFGSRELQLTGSLLAADSESLSEQIERFRGFLAGLPATSVLRCDWGQWAVSLRKEVKITPRRRIAPVTLTFTESLPPQPDLSGQSPEWPGQWILATRQWRSRGVWRNSSLWYDIPRPGAWILDTSIWDYGGRWDQESEWYGNSLTDLDEWRWESFGLTLAGVDGLRDLPASRELKANVLPPSDTWAKGGLDKHSLSLIFNLHAADMADLSRKSRSLYWLFGQPGLRILRYRGRGYNLFATEGFKISGIQKRDRVHATLTLKLTEAHE